MFVGRQEQLSFLSEKYNSHKAEFVVGWLEEIRLFNVYTMWKVRKKLAT